MPSSGLIQHPETGHPYAPGSWELSHTAAEIALVRKSWQSHASLTDEEREQLLKICGPLTGKAIAYPESLTREERDQVMGWPDPETMKTNLENVGLGHLSPQEILKMAYTGAEWMTRMQAYLVSRRFRATPYDPCRFYLQTEVFAAEDEKAAYYAVVTKEERHAYLLASMRFDELEKQENRTLLEQQQREAQEAEQAAQRDYEEREAKGQLTEEEKLMLKLAEEEHKLETQAQAERDATFGMEKFGFIIYKTADLPSVLDDYLSDTARHPACEKPIQEEFGCLGSFQSLWEAFLKRTVFGTSGEHQCEMEVMYKALAGEDEGRHIAHQLTITLSPEAFYPAADAKLLREEHRRHRKLPAGTQDWLAGLHPRYFLVMDKAGFPPVETIMFSEKVALPEVWVYDADWEPPVDGDGERDADGYDGRLRVRFAYNVYFHFWPLTRQEGFDMKELWLKQEDHNKPYPFPGHDVTYANVRDRVPYDGKVVPIEIWVKLAMSQNPADIAQLNDINKERW